MYSPSTGMRCMAWKAFGRLSPVTSYDAGIVRVSMTRRPSERRRMSVGSIAGGPKSATRATRSAADTYFSISTGESDSTSAMLSKPYPASSCGKSSAGRTSTPSSSLIVLLYSVRLRRRAVTRPGSGGVAASIRSSSRASHVATAWRCSSGGCSSSSGGISPRRSLPTTSSHWSRCSTSDALELERLEVEVVLLLLVAVAGEAVLGEERFDDGVEAGRRRGSRRSRGCRAGLRLARRLRRPLGGAHDDDGAEERENRGATARTSHARWRLIGGPADLNLYAVMNYGEMADGRSSGFGPRSGRRSRSRRRRAGSQVVYSPGVQRR